MKWKGIVVGATVLMCCLIYVELNRSQKREQELAELIAKERARAEETRKKRLAKKENEKEPTYLIGMEKLHVDLEKLGVDPSILKRSPETPTIEREREWFARDLVESIPGVEHAWWSQNISLWIKIDMEIFGSNAKVYATEIADEVSRAASAKFGYVCVRVYHGKQKVLARSCGK